MPVSVSDNIEYFDVLIVGAGISGIGAAYHLQSKSPDRTYAILEGRSQLGGTWDLFRYPGIRSDSDMQTLGYNFRPWTGDKLLADGPAILSYLHDVVDEFGIGPNIRYDHLVRQAEWSSEDATWTVTTSVDGATTTYRCNFLFMCSGYYSYKGGYTPEFAGSEHFTGTIVHPQKWPEDLDYTNKKVVVIGSGATAVTLVPAMANDAALVTMLQRSPSYIVSVPSEDPFHKLLSKVVSEDRAFRISRRRHIKIGAVMVKACKRWPKQVKKVLLRSVRNALPEGYDVDTHFTPHYEPWDERMCMVPDGDLFRALSNGTAEMVTDHIERFTETGIQLTSGRHLDADIIVTATGLNLVTLGEAEFSVDGQPVDFANTWTYKGLGLEGVPNLATAFGYVTASWTLRVDLVSEFVCRMLNHMRDTRTDICTPTLRPGDAGMPKLPLVEGFSSGYLQRAVPFLPKNGNRAPWQYTQNYAADEHLFREAPVDDGVLQFERSAACRDRRSAFMPRPIELTDAGAPGRT